MYVESLIYSKGASRLKLAGADELCGFVCFRPNDSRMLVALGECYEKLSQQIEAKKVRSSKCHA